jgi:hypothetical protein
MHCPITVPVNTFSAVIKGNARRESDMAAYEIDTVLDGIVKRRSVEPGSVVGEGNS